MRSILLGTLVTLPLLTACGATPPSSSGEAVGEQDDALVQAVPQAQWLELPAPPPVSPVNSGADVPPPLPACMGGPPAKFAALTGKVTGDANGLADGILGVVANLMSTPPAAAGPDHALWGPLTDPQSPAVYVLEVTQVDPQAFRFELRGSPKADPKGPSLTVFDGVTQTADPTHRLSDMHVDFGARHALDPAADPVAGNAIIHYGIADGARTVEITFGGMAGKMAPAPNDAHYLFRSGPEGGGSFDFVTRTDFDHDGTLDELLHVQSLWAKTGIGTAHVSVSEGSLGPKSVNAAECWDPAGRSVFYLDEIAANPPVGNPDCCPKPPPPAPATP